MAATVTIRKINREKIVVENCAIATDKDHAQHITDLAIALNGVELEEVKVAEYAIDGKGVFAYLRQADGLHICTPTDAEDEDEKTAQETLKADLNLIVRYAGFLSGAQACGTLDKAAIPFIKAALESMRQAYLAK